MLIGWGVGIVDWSKANVEVFLEEDSVAYTGPWFMGIGNSDIEIPEELRESKLVWSRSFMPTV